MTAPPAKLSKLRDEKQRKFLEIYFTNGCDAVDAFMRSRGLTKRTKSVKVHAYKYMNKATIRPYIDEARSKVVAKTEKVLEKYAVTQERIIEELAKIAFTPITDVLEYGPDGVIVKNSSELTPEAMGAISSVEEGETKSGDKIIKVKMGDRKGALEILGKHLGMFTEKHEHRHLAVNFIIEK